MDALLFENEAWAVTAAGLEHRASGYFIPREQIGERRGDGLWNWPLHLSEKTWADPRSFAQAFLRAIAAYGLRPDARLSPSFPPPGRWAATVRDAESGWTSLGDLAGAEVEALRQAAGDNSTDVLQVGGATGQRGRRPAASLEADADADDRISIDDRELRRAAGGRR